jgi:nucleoside 2-deoxyribosyltransferase
MSKIYIAAAFNGKDDKDTKRKRENCEKLRKILIKKFDENSIYAPWELRFPNAWDYPNEEWGLMVFAADIANLEKADIVVSLNYGRLDPTAGTAWECGYAFAKGKKVIMVEMSDDAMSLMCSNGCYARLKGLEELEDYDFDLMIPTRTDTEQK